MGLLGTSWASASFPLAGENKGGGLSGEMSITEYGLTLRRDPGFPIVWKKIDKLCTIHTHCTAVAVGDP